MPHVPINGIDLYYEVEGNDAGPWVFFAHGGEGTHLHWWKQVLALRDDFRCVTFDARGFGLSRRESGPSSMGGQDADLLALMDHLGADRAFLVGQSMGGGAISGVAQKHPERVLGLVMGDTPFGFQTAAMQEWAAGIRDRITTQGFDVAQNLFAPGFEERDPETAYLFHAFSRLNPPRTGPRGLDAYDAMKSNPPGDYSTFSVPTLFIVGDQDALTFPSLIKATAEAVNGAQFVEVSNAGHSVYVEQADTYNRLLREFFTTCAP